MTWSCWRSTRAGCASRSAQAAAREPRRLQGQDDPRAPVAGAGRRHQRAGRQRRPAPAARRLPGAPERHGRRRWRPTSAWSTPRSCTRTPSTSPANVNLWPFPTALVDEQGRATTRSPPTSRRRSPTRPRRSPRPRWRSSPQPSTFPQDAGQLRRRVHRLDPGAAHRAPERWPDARSASWLRESQAFVNADPAAEGRACRRRPAAALPDHQDRRLRAASGLRQHRPAHCGRELNVRPGPRTGGRAGARRGASAGGDTRREHDRRPGSRGAARAARRRAGAPRLGASGPAGSRSTRRPRCGSRASASWPRSP